MRASCPYPVLTLNGLFRLLHEHGLRGGVKRGVLLPVVGLTLADVLQVAHAGGIATQDAWNTSNHTEYAILCACAIALQLG